MAEVATNAHAHLQSCPRPSRGKQPSICHHPDGPALNWTRTSTGVVYPAAAERRCDLPRIRGPLRKPGAIPPGQRQPIDLWAENIAGLTPDVAADRRSLAHSAV